MVKVLLKSFGIWLVILLTAILNAVIREEVIAPLTGAAFALPVSGVSLAILVFAITWFSVPFIAASGAKTYLFVGLLWLVLTLAFEFLLAYFVVGEVWRELMQLFDVLDGNLFVVVLLVITIAPWAVAKMREMC